MDAVFESWFANIFWVWTLLVLAEISVIKALLVYKFSLIVGLDENFAGRLLFKFNLGYILIRVSRTGSRPGDPEAGP